MRVLLDENFPLPLLSALRRERLDAEHIITLGLRGTPDRNIRTRLDAEAVLFLTQDTEFLMAPMRAAAWVTRVSRQAITDGCRSRRRLASGRPGLLVHAPGEPDS